MTLAWVFAVTVVPGGILGSSPLTSIGVPMVNVRDVGMSRRCFHDVDVPGQRRLLQAAELEGAPDLEVEALDVAAPGEGGDGQHVADLEPVQLQQRSEVPVEDLVPLVEVRIVGVEEGVEEPVQVPLRRAEGSLEHLDRLLRLQAIQLKEDLPGLGPVFPDVPLEGVVTRDRSVEVQGFLDLVQAPRGPQLEPVLVHELGHQEAPVAGRHRLAVDDLHPVEVLLERVEIRSHVPEGHQVGVREQRCDPVLQELERSVGVTVEALPELVGRRALNGLLGFRIDRVGGVDLRRPAHVRLEHANDLTDVLLQRGALCLQLGRGPALLLLAHHGAQLLQRQVDGVPAGDQRGVDPHGDEIGRAHV